MNKTSLAVVLFLLVPFLLLVKANSILPCVQAQTEVRDTINVNTTWNKAGSPYKLTTPITITPGETLTIEPGVQVNLNGNYLQTNGTLIAQGTPNEKVYLSGGSLILNSDSVIGNAVLSNDLSVTVNSGSPTITNCQVDSRIIVKGGAPTISNNVIFDGIHADAAGGPATIENNQLTSRNGFAVIYVQGIHADISGNTIEGNKRYMGIQIYHIASSASIRNNTISNCSYGIHLFTGPREVDITHNTVFNNTVGIKNQAGMNSLRENTIAYNEIGMQSVHQSTIENNNFQNNSRFNLENIHIVDFDAPNNWWGTTDTQLIESMIFDKDDESVRGQVNFLPILAKPNSDAPAVPAESVTTPVPTPTAPTKGETFPTMPVLIIVVAGVVVAGAGLLLIRKSRKRSQVHG